LQRPSTSTIHAARPARRTRLDPRVTQNTAGVAQQGHSSAAQAPRAAAVDVGSRGRIAKARPVGQAAAPRGDRRRKLWRPLRLQASTAVMSTSSSTIPRGRSTSGHRSLLRSSPPSHPLDLSAPPAAPVYQQFRRHTKNIGHGRRWLTRSCREASAASRAAWTWRTSSTAASPGSFPAGHPRFQVVVARRLLQRVRPTPLTPSRLMKRRVLDHCRARPRSQSLSFPFPPLSPFFSRLVVVVERDYGIWSCAAVIQTRLFMRRACVSGVGAYTLEETAERPT